MKKLKTQLKNNKEIRSVLREVDVGFELEGGISVDTLLVYLPCKSGICDYSKLLEVIKQSIMANFALAYSEIERKLSIESKETSEELFKKSVRKISQHTAKGELGELLLFTLLDVYLEAPKILTKLSFKTSRRMPVYGADAVHAQYKDGALRLYLGESKMHKNFTTAVTKAANSISDSIDNYETEFDLIDSHIDFPEIDLSTCEELISILNPFDQEEFDPETLHTPCFIGFVEPTIFSDDEEEYRQQYIDLACDHIAQFYSKLEEVSHERNKTTLMLLPLSSLDDLVKDFIAHMGIEK